MSEQFSLAVSSDRPPEQFHSFFGSLALDLSRQHGLDVTVPERPSQPGERSAAASLVGELAIQLVAAGAVNALLTVLKSYIERDRSVRFQLTRPDGRNIEITAKNLDVKALPDTLRELQKLSG